MPHPDALRLAADASHPHTPSIYVPVVTVSGSIWYIDVMRNCRDTTPGRFFELDCKDLINKRLITYGGHMGRRPWSHDIGMMDGQAIAHGLDTLITAANEWKLLVQGISLRFVSVE